MLQSVTARIASGVSFVLTSDTSQTVGDKQAAGKTFLYTPLKNDASGSVDHLS